MSNLLPIRHLANALGVPTATLRTWERRYDIFSPVRSEKGQRRYSSGDMERAFQLRHLLDDGLAIKEAIERLNKGLGN